MLSSRTSLWLVLVCLAGVVVPSLALRASVPVASRASADRVPQQAGRKPTPAVLRGKVVELGPHLKDAFDVPMDDDLGKAIVALVAESGELYPLIKDLRSRGFFMDKRLRGRPVELHVHRYAGLPFVRLIDAFTFKEGKKHKVDYWCTVCSISTFEPGPCPCCQDEIELREQPVEGDE